MISLEKENEIKLLLKRGVSARDVAFKVGVSRGTVNSVKKNKRIRNRIIRKRKIRHSLPRKCPTCEGVVTIWPCLLCNPETGDYNLDNYWKSEIKNERYSVNNLSYENFRELTSIVSDVNELHKLNLIKNVLFDSLANRARFVMKKLIDNRKGELSAEESDSRNS